MRGKVRRGDLRPARHHAGCILIWSFDHVAFGPILDGIRTILARHPDPRRWRELLIAL